MMEYTCPVCGYDRLTEAPYDERGNASYSICPCCDTEFGYDDATAKHETLRNRWIEKGTPWWSKYTPPYVGWNPVTQLDNLRRMSGAK